MPARKKNKAELLLSIITIPADLSTSHDSAWDQTPLTTLKERDSFGCAGNTHTHGTSWQAGDEQELEESESYMGPGGSIHTAQTSAAVWLLRKSKQTNSFYWDLTSFRLQGISDFRPQLNPILTRVELPSRDFSGIQKNDVTPNLSNCCLNPFWTLAADPFYGGFIGSVLSSEILIFISERKILWRGKKQKYEYVFIWVIPVAVGELKLQTSPEGGTSYMLSLGLHPEVLPLTTVGLGMG